MNDKEQYESYAQFAITETEAHEAGYGRLTLPYKKHEAKMLVGVVRDMADKPFAIVFAGSGYEVWRKGMLTVEEARLERNKKPADLRAKTY